MLDLYEKINKFIINNIFCFICGLALLNLDTIMNLFKILIYKNEVFDSQGIGVIVSSVLTLATVILAWIAFKSSVKANEISKLALESERPKVVFKYINKEFQLTNEGNSDAIDLTIIVKPKGEKTLVAYEKINVSTGIKNILPFEMAKERNISCSIVLVYKNGLITDKYYIQSYLIKTQSNEEATQLNEDENLIKYSDYYNIYKQTNIFSYSETIKAFLMQ